jgi:hypothetical protein
MLRITTAALGGALVGYLYQRFVGCNQGACPIMSTPFLSTLYGALVGLLMARI